MNKDQLLTTIDNLIDESDDIYAAFIYHYCLESSSARYTKEDIDEAKKKLEKYKKFNFNEEYQKWYAKILSIIKIIIPERLEEFQRLYLPSSTRKDINLINYTIFDAIRGLYNRSNNVSANSALDLLSIQIGILKSLKDVVENRLNEITNMLEFDVFEKEIDSARFLLKNKYLRSAGAICGVILEKHLLNMLSKVGEKPTKKNPALNDLNEDLYNKKIINSTQFKFILFLGDIRNKCDHNKTQDPTKEEVEDLINGTDKVIKTY